MNVASPLSVSVSVPHSLPFESLSCCVYVNEYGPTHSWTAAKVAAEVGSTLARALAVKFNDAKATRMNVVMYRFTVFSLRPFVPISSVFSRKSASDHSRIDEQPIPFREVRSFIVYFVACGMLRPCGDRFTGTGGTSTADVSTGIAAGCTIVMMDALLATARLTSRWRRRRHARFGRSRPDRFFPEGMGALLPRCA